MQRLNFFSLKEKILWSYLCQDSSAVEIPAKKCRGRGGRLCHFMQREVYLFSHLIQYAYFNLHLLSYVNMSKRAVFIELEEYRIKGYISKLGLFATWIIRRNLALGKFVLWRCSQSGVLEKQPAWLLKETLWTVIAPSLFPL